MSEPQGAVSLALLGKLAWIRQPRSHGRCSDRATARPGRSRNTRRHRRSRSHLLVSTACELTSLSSKAELSAWESSSARKASRAHHATFRSQRSRARFSAARSRSAKAAGPSRSPVRKPSTMTRLSSPERTNPCETFWLLPWNEVYGQEHNDDIAGSVRSAVSELTRPAMETPSLTI